MQSGVEWEVRNDRSVNIDQPHSWVICEDMTAAILAPFAMAPVGFAVRADCAVAFDDRDAVSRPEREGVDRTSRPMPA
jgi:hypothetical protein